MTYRFIKEYANYVKGCIVDTLDIKPELQKQLLEIRVNRILYLRRKGLITVDETMKLLTSVNIFDLVEEFQKQ